MSADHADELPIPDVSHAVVTARPDVETIWADDEALLYDPVIDRIHVLNATGALIWDCLDGSGTVRELANDIARAAGADASQVLTAVSEIVQRLAVDDLLVGYEPDTDDEAVGGEPEPREPLIWAVPPSS